jgi:hypothetical protein
MELKYGEERSERKPGKDLSCKARWLVAHVLQTEGETQQPPALQIQWSGEKPRRSKHGSDEEIAPDQGVDDLAGPKAVPGDQRLRPATANVGFQGKVEQEHPRGGQQGALQHPPEDNENFRNGRQVTDREKGAKETRRKHEGSQAQGSGVSCRQGLAQGGRTSK